MLTEGINNKVFFEKEGQTRKLIIRSISVHDDGEYTCSLGDQECTAEINVIGTFYFFLNAIYVNLSYNFHKLIYL